MTTLAVGDATVVRVEELIDTTFTHFADPHGAYVSPRGAAFELRWLD